MAQEIAMQNNGGDLSPEESKQQLSQESKEILNQIIKEQDTAKVKDLTYLFNINQNKKTMARINKLNDLYDLVTEQAMVRFTKRPDELTNQEILQALKIVQDITERSQKQVVGVDTPLIQINQQTNEVNMGDNLSKESKEKVKSAVMSILEGIYEPSNENNPTTTEEIPEVITGE